MTITPPPRPADQAERAPRSAPSSSPPPSPLRPLASGPSGLSGPSSSGPPIPYVTPRVGEPSRASRAIVEVDRVTVVGIRAELATAGLGLSDRGAC
jgi:hypothetical protein